jgi:hypothetical protein
MLPAAALPFVLALGGAAVAATDAPVAIKWAQLVPPAPPKPPKAFFAGRPNVDPSSATPLPPADEARWMSAPAPERNGLAPAVVETLNGKRVQIGGYVVPLDFDSTQVKEFLLVPFVGACIHVPPPPANQIIYVKAATSFEVKGQFDPVFVTGILSTDSTSTGLAEAGYTLAAEKVEERKE